MTFFRYPTDRLPVTIILGLTGLDFLMYFLVDNLYVLAAYFIVMIIPKGCICAWNHHHQHTKTFRQTFLNRVLELSYALHTGVTTNLWLLHHVFGHHHNYLDQTKDESRWKRRDGTPMGMWEYTLSVAGTSYYRGYLVGKKYPTNYRAHLTWTIVTLVIVAALTWFNPVAAILLFILPMIISMLITAWATFDHHAGLDSDDDMTASYNQLNPLFNVLTGNLGYHTAHHYKQGVHWSDLPALHEKIKDKIPANLYKGSVWDAVTESPIQRLVYRLLGLA